MPLESSCLDNRSPLEDGSATPLTTVDPRLDEVPLCQLSPHGELNPDEIGGWFAFNQTTIVASPVSAGSRLGLFSECTVGSRVRRAAPLELRDAASKPTKG